MPRRHRLGLGPAQPRARDGGWRTPSAPTPGDRCPDRPEGRPPGSGALNEQEPGDRRAPGRRARQTVTARRSIGRRGTAPGPSDLDRGDRDPSWGGL